MGKRIYKVGTGSLMSRGHRSTSIRAQSDPVRLELVPLLPNSLNEVMKEPYIGLDSGRNERVKIRNKSRGFYSLQICQVSNPYLLQKNSNIGQLEDKFKG